MKTLIIAEKPDMGRNIAAAIEPRARNCRTYLEGETYIITWAIGHLVSLAEPDAYDDRYKKWRFSDLPIIPDSFKLIANARTKEQLHVIRDLAKRCKQLINACDAGREGQLIFSLIQRYLRLNQPVKRLWISDLTPESIRKGFAELKDHAQYDALTRAARARSEADWLIGMNGSRAFTTKHSELLSVGRVQTPVLALLHDRQNEIEAFQSTTYYEVEARFEQTESAYRGIWQGERIVQKERAQAIAFKVKGKTGRIENYEVKQTREYPFKLYDLTLLQREANAKLGLSAKKTLELAQNLYEKHKVITYPRTSSNYVTEQNVVDMHKTLSRLGQLPAYRLLVQGANPQLVHKGNKAVCNPAKVEDHHAILPTFKMAGSLPPDEAKLYEMIVRRFIAQFYPPAQYKLHAMITLVEQERFKSTVKELLQIGWKAVYADMDFKQKTGNKQKRTNEAVDKEEEAEETAEPFVLDADKAVTCAEAEAKEKVTQPPKPYTEGTLLKAMESAGKQIEDEELREAIKDSGIGTPATRAAIIERLKQVGYVVMQGKRMMITQKGRTAVQLIRDAGIDLLTSSEMTGQWERRLNQIARGDASDERFMLNVKKFASIMVEKVGKQATVQKAAFGDSKKATSRKRTVKQEQKSASKQAIRPSGGPIGPCPRPGCGGEIIMGRRGYGCTHYRSGCSFVIWKESFGKKLSDAAIKALLTKGKTGRFKFKGRFSAEPDYEAKMVLVNPATGELKLERI